jgi:hypothetical protein
MIPGRVKKGDPLRIGAETWNQILQVVRDSQPGAGASGKGFRFVQSVSASNPFTVTAGSGLNALRAEGYVFAMDGRDVAPQVDVMEGPSGRLIPAATHALTDDRYNVIAIRADYFWTNFYKPLDMTGEDSMIYAALEVNDSGATPILTDYKTKTIGQLIADTYAIAVDTIDTTAWEGMFPQIKPDNLENSFTNNPADKSFVNVHVLYYPIAVVKTEDGTITEITQIQHTHFHDPRAGNIVIVPGDTWAV